MWVCMFASARAPLPPKHTLVYLYSGAEIRREGVEDGRHCPLLPPVSVCTLPQPAPDLRPAFNKRDWSLSLKAGRRDGRGKEMERERRERGQGGWEKGRE